MEDNKKEDPTPPLNVDNKDFEFRLQKELDKLPYTKHLDDGQYNDGLQCGFEFGATWALREFTNDVSKIIYDDSYSAQEKIGELKKELEKLKNS